MWGGGRGRGKCVCGDEWRRREGDEYRLIDSDSAWLAGTRRRGWSARLRLPLGRTRAATRARRYRAIVARLFVAARRGAAWVRGHVIRIRLAALQPPFSIFRCSLGRERRTTALLVATVPFFYGGAPHIHQQPRRCAQSAPNHHQLASFLFSSLLKFTSNVKP